MGRKNTHVDEDVIMQDPYEDEEQDDKLSRKKVVHFDD